jgi:hypothetical protein
MNRIGRILSAVCIAIVVAGVALAGCVGATSPWLQDNAASTQPADATSATRQEGKPAVAATPAVEPEFITVQHILIGFKDSIPDPSKNITRSKEEAEALANEILEMAKAEDADFDALVKKYTDDSHPGIYKMANSSVPANKVPRGVFSRSRMVRAFGDIGFPLQVGGIGLAEFDEKVSPYGWHIIKRIE